MQYGGEINHYKKINNEKNKKDTAFSARETLENIIILLFTLLISRVSLINNFAPFGIAMVAAGLNIKRKKLSRVALGASIGYLTLINSMDNFWMYLIILLAIYGYSKLPFNLNIKQNIGIVSVLVSFIQILYNYFVNEYTFNVCLLNSSINLIILIPIIMLFTYAITAVLKFNTNYGYKNEELIAIATMISLIAAGTYGVNFGRVSLMNIFSLIFIIVISYINGLGVGASTGVAFGIACGMSTNNMMDYIGLYSICALAAGMFKDYGKIITTLVTIIALTIALIYLNFNASVSIMEGLISSFIFLVFPRKVYQVLKREFNFTSKQEVIKDNYFGKIKDTYLKKMQSFSQVLIYMSKVLEELADNDKLAMKHKSVTLVEILADRVCSECNMHHICWNREAYLTLSAFEELLQDEDEYKTKLPNELERKCVKRTALIKHTKEIMNNYIISEMKKKRLTQGRELLASQIRNMAKSVDEISEEFTNELTFNSEFEDNLIKGLNRDNIRYNDLICYKNKEDKDVVKITMDSCSGEQYCVKNIIPLIKRITHKEMSMVKDGCSINPNTNKCTVTLEEKPKYQVISYVKSEAPNEEKVCGDSYSSTLLNHGKYMMLISDGMGKGARAERESCAVTELMEKFLVSGLSRTTAIDTINSIMTMKFEEEEKYTTIDLGTVDLYDGEVEIIKIGAVATFVKKREKVEVLKSETLPIGVLENPDIDIVKTKVRNGDLIIMISDGVLDYDEENSAKIDWLIEYLSTVKISDPKKLAEDIINKARELSGGSINDDMTAMVSMVCNAS